MSVRIQACLIAGLLLPAAVALADEAKLGAVKDNTLYENPDGPKSNGADEYFFSGRTSRGLLRRALIQFDIGATIPKGSTITSVALRLHCSKSRAETEDFSLHRVVSGWGEGDSDAGSPGGEGTDPSTGDATWEHTFFSDKFWESKGGDYLSGTSATAEMMIAGFYTWGSTAELVTDVQAWLDGTAANFGWILRGGESTNSSAKRLDTHENDLTQNRPVLTVQFTPPSSCERCDTNCDGSVDLTDVGPFIGLLFGDTPCAECSGGHEWRRIGRPDGCRRVHRVPAGIAHTTFV